MKRAVKAAQTRKKKIKQFTGHDRYCQEYKMCVNAKISHDNNACSTHIILVAVYNLNS